MKQIEKEEEHTQETYSVENYVINNCYLVDYSSYYSHATVRAESLDGKLRFGDVNHLHLLSSVV